jgi:hypothetical protein
MNDTTDTTTDQETQYLLLFRGPDWDRGKSPEEARGIMDRVMAWFDGLQQRGIVRGGRPLAREGKFVSGESRTVADGPFAESKEVIGGYLVVAVDSLAAATAIARECPTLDHGITIEVRPLLWECPCTKRILEQPALAAA